MAPIVAPVAPPLAPVAPVAPPVGEPGGTPGTCIWVETVSGGAVQSDQSQATLLVSSSFALVIPCRYVLAGVVAGVFTRLSVQDLDFFNVSSLVVL